MENEERQILAESDVFILKDFNIDEGRRLTSVPFSGRQYIFIPLNKTGRFFERSAVTRYELSFSQTYFFCCCCCLKLESLGYTADEG